MTMPDRAQLHCQPGPATDGSRRGRSACRLKCPMTAQTTCRCCGVPRCRRRPRPDGGPGAAAAGGDGPWLPRRCRRDGGRGAGSREIRRVDQFAADYPQGPHDKPQSMCPAFGSLRVGLRMKRGRHRPVWQRLLRLWPDLRQPFLRRPPFGRLCAVQFRKRSSPASCSRIFAKLFTCSPIPTATMPSW